jgi:hypothetical protein
MFRAFNFKTLSNNLEGGTAVKFKQIQMTFGPSSGALSYLYSNHIPKLKKANPNLVVKVQNGNQTSVQLVFDEKTVNLDITNCKDSTDIYKKLINFSA